ncbi:helix-turn-helix domain-containing protein [Sphaerisporangium sp. TRM90804]|uniref:helix-turn-helix transcriptional regulator n=1 Tax=Sphaerisporangium sp. TRM90804 TaxID=3031113 RepID=UPI002446E32F|nr:helix-turn-helix domain-containing protein [Sphaerisporangium sp. TRM90804]MDH2428314.1 helix-turn-helix domain-containing protein [Sphaerisporangium sp. TRM90804]
MLEAIGLSQQDEAVYDALVRRTQATLTELVHDCHLPASAARRTLRSLVELGLATRSTGRPVRYVAVAPDSGLEAVLREREAGLRDVRLHVRTLMKMYRAGTRFAHPGELIEVVSGRDEVNHRWVQMQQNTHAQMRGFDLPPYAARQGHTESNHVELALLKRGVKYRVIYDRTALELPGWLDDVTVGMRQGEQARIAPDLPMKLAISDDRLAIIPLLRPGDDVVTASYLIHPSPLLDALVALFEAVWARSVPVQLTSPDAEALSEEETRLLTLLAAGATDKAAGRALGWSERTVQRHVTKLMRRVGARTRFQIAMEATRRGWI